MPKEPRPLHDLHPLRLLPLALCLAMVVFCIIRGGFSVEDILSYAPRNVWLAAGFLLLLYLAKSLSVAFPIIVLQVAAGHLFAPAAALALNVLGLAVDLTVPFWIGRFSGSGLTTRLLARYPRLDGLLESQEGHYLFLSFFLRVIYLLPGDIVSMYFGSGTLSHLSARRAAGRPAQPAGRHPAGRQRFTAWFPGLLARPWHHRRGLRPFSSGLSPLAKASKEQNLTPHPTESLFAGGDLFPPHV